MFGEELSQDNGFQERENVSKTKATYYSDVVYHFKLLTTISFPDFPKQFHDVLISMLEPN